MPFAYGSTFTKHSHYSCTKLFFVNFDVDYVHITQNRINNVERMFTVMNVRISVIKVHIIALQCQISNWKVNSLIWHKFHFALTSKIRNL